MKHLKTFESHIYELNKSTYFSAAKISREAGRTKLAQRFTSHSAEHGTSEVGLVSFMLNNDEDIIVDNINVEIIPPRTNSTCRIKITGNDGDETIRIIGGVYDGKLNLFLRERTAMLAKTVRDAKIIIDLINDQGIELNIKPKDFAYDYVEFSDVYK
jgi:hypothetical protein